MSEHAFIMFLIWWFVVGCVVAGLLCCVFKSGGSDD